MTLEILICTTIERLKNVEQVLLPPIDGVRYLVSCQGIEAGAEDHRPSDRCDLTFIAMPHRGLSRNRNAALRKATGDLLLMADDDEQLDEQTVRGIPSDFEQHPEWDLIQYQMDGAGKSYPSDYVSSCELVMRRKVAESVSFDERFGIGSEELASGEEEVFVSDATKAGFSMGRLDKVVCHIQGATTGQRFLQDARVQRSKGAVFCRTRGAGYAYYKCTREALGWMLRKGVNPWPLLKNMFWGIRYVKA